MMVEPLPDPSAGSAGGLDWTASAAPLGLGLAGPLLNGVGVRGGLVVSAVLTIALVPLAAAGLRRRSRDRAEVNGGQPAVS